MPNDNTTTRWEKTYQLVSGPPPMAWAEYERIVADGWQHLLNDASTSEADVQSFIERHPCLIPGPFGLIGQSGHSPFPSALISQPVLPDFTRRIPDFMWIARDSVTIYPILIEIEAPAKPWWTRGGTQHASLTQAREQITEWMAWFDDPLNVARFTGYYRIDSREMSIRPQYVLIYGRRSEANRTLELSQRRASQSRPAEFLMTYDRLVPQSGADDFFTVKVDRNGYKAMFAPPTLELGPIHASDRVRLRDKEEAVRASPYFTQARRDFVLSRLSYWDQWARDPSGIVSTADSE